jgi:hypothetical protein
MKQTRLGTAAPLLILLLSIVACRNPFEGEPSFASKGPTPNQIVNIPAILETSHDQIKSRQEIKALIGVPPKREDSISMEWSFPEGSFTVYYFDGKRDFMALTPKAPGVDSIEDMAALAGIDLKGRQPDNFSNQRSAYGYYNLDVNGKTVSADFERMGDKIPMLRVHEQEKTVK